MSSPVADAGDSGSSRVVADITGPHRAYSTNNCSVESHATDGSTVCADGVNSEPCTPLPSSPTNATANVAFVAIAPLLSDHGTPSPQEGPRQRGHLRGTGDECEEANLVRIK